MALEQWDIYNIHKEKTNEVVTRGDLLKKGQYHLVVHICYFNQKNEMLIQQRSPIKATWSGLWDISVGGAVRSGETSQMAASRESLEEIGVHHDFSNQLPNLSTSFERGFDDIYLVRKEIDIKDIHFTDKEVSDAKWASKSEILEMIDQNLFVPIHSKAFINLLFDKII